jgi:hypothetical protein
MPTRACVQHNTLKLILRMQLINCTCPQLYIELINVHQPGLIMIQSTSFELDIDIDIAIAIAF